MWKDLAKEIKKNIFLHADDTNSLYYPDIITAGIKARPTDEKGIYKTNKMYQMRIGDIKPLLLEWLKRSKADCIISKNLPDALGINDRMVFFRMDDTLKYIIYNNGYYNFDKGWGDTWEDKNNDNYIEFALFSEMKEIEKNAKEKAILEERALTQRRIKFNSLVIKDNLLAAFKKAGYPLTSDNNSGTLFSIDQKYNYSTGTYENGQAYNKFIEAAIDHYVNNVIAKDLGCKIHIPTPSAKKGVRYFYDTIIDIEQIDICNNGEQDGSENLNR